MKHDTSLQVSRKHHPSREAIVVVLLVIHGIAMIVIGLMAFFAGFAGAYDISNGHVTSGALIAVLGAVLAWIFLLGGIVSFLCVQGLLTHQHWAFWLTIALEVTNLLVGGCVLVLRLFVPWPIVLSMCVAAGILLYVVIEQHGEVPGKHGDHDGS